MKFNSRKILVILLLLLAPTTESMATELTGLQIMQRAYDVYAGKDIFSRLSFTLKDRNDTEKKLGLLMAYKSYEGENGFHSKIIMFNQFPPDKKDISFLAWIYAPEQHKKDDMWLYLPELRTVRKLTHQHNANKHKHHDKDNDDEFSLSELNYNQEIRYWMSMCSWEKKTLGRRKSIKFPALPKTRNPPPIIKFSSGSQLITS